VDRHWPELYIVGAPRAGTSSLWSYLGQHPQIFMSRLKEPHFFGSYKPTFLPFVSDEESYLRLFDAARPGQLRGEASPSYLADAVAPYAIARARPDARILAILREPVARAYSTFWHKVRYGQESRTFLEATRANLADRVARRTSATFTGGGLYPDHLARYFELFDGRVLVLFFEELVADTRAELRRTFRFLGVDEAAADRVRLGVRNAAGLPRNALVRQAYASTRLRSVGARIVPNALQPLLEGVLLRQAGMGPIDGEARRLLEEFYAPERAPLERLLGRAVPWAGDDEAGPGPGAPGLPRPTRTVR
jgi:hypothetical protein